MAHYFKVIKEIKTETIETSVESYHFSVERQERRQNIQRLVGKGKLVTSFIVDRQHKKGYTREYLFDNGVVLVVNEKTHRIVTEYISRPSHIRRYWDYNVPSQYQYIVNIARKWQNLGYID